MGAGILWVLSRRLFFLQKDLYFGFNVKRCRIKDDFSYTDWEIKVLPDSNKWVSIVLMRIKYFNKSDDEITEVKLGVIFG